MGQDRPTSKERRALAVVCPYCVARPGAWCSETTLKGDPPTWNVKVHNDRHRAARYEQ